MKKQMINTNEFHVPDWLVGTGSDVEKAIRKRAREWAAAWQSERKFPPPNLVDPGTPAPLLYATSDLVPEQPRARLFANANFVPQILEVFGYRDIETVTTEYESHVGGTPWGSFEALLFERSPLGFESTRARLQRIVPHLPVLQVTSVVDYDNAQRPAAAVVDQQISSTLENWSAPGGEPLEARINAALAEMERSTPEEVQERIVASMLRLVPIAPRLRNHQALTAGRIFAEFALMDSREREDLTGCTQKALMTELYAIDRQISKEGHS